MQIVMSKSIWAFYSSDIILGSFFTVKIQINAFFFLEYLSVILLWRKCLVPIQNQPFSFQD